MIELESLRLRNIALHKKTQFTFEPGIHVIRGCNLDAKDGNANASGKSSLFMPIHAIAMGETPWAARKGHVKDLGGSVSLTFKRDGEPYEVSLEAGKQAFAVTKNGVPVEFQRKPDARGAVRRLFPWSEALFRSTIYLNSAIPNPVLKSGPTQRHIFFEELFQVTILDKLNDWFKVRASKLKDAQVELDALLSTLPAKVPSADDVRALTEETAVLERKLRKANKALTRAIRHTERIESLARMREELGEYADTPETELRALAAKAEKAERAARADVRAAERAEEQAELSKERAFLRAAIKALPKTAPDPVPLRRKHAALSEQADRLPALEKAARITAAIGQALPKLAAKLGAPVSTPARLEDWVAARIEALTDRKTMLKRHAAECAVCGTRLDKGHAERLIARAERDLAILRKHADTVSKMARDAANVPQGDLDAAKQAAERLLKVTKALKEAEHAVEQVAERASMLKRLADVERRIEPVEFKGSIDDAERALRRAERASVRLQRALALRQAIAALRMPEGSPADPRALQARVDDLSEKVSAARTRLNLATSTVERAADLQARIQPLQASLKDKPALDALLKQTGPKGVRTHMIRALFDQYLDNLNRAAPLILTSPYTFAATWGPRALGITATQGKLTTDIRSLSGFESRAFEILHLIALGPLLPAAWRCNTVILDEIEANLSSQNRQRLAEELIPALAEQVPCVVMITPFSEAELRVPDAIEHTVVRKGNVATLRVK